MHPPRVDVVHPRMVELSKINRQAVPAVAARHHLPVLRRELLGVDPPGF